MRAFVTVLVVGLLLSSCGADAERRAAVAREAPVGMTRFSDERRGFEVTFLVTIQERANAVSGEMRAGPPQLDAVVPDGSETIECVTRDVPYRTYWMPFQIGGRGFYADAAVGDDVPPQGRAELQAVLDSFDVSGQGG